MKTYKIRQAISEYVFIIYIIFAFVQAANFFYDMGVSKNAFLYTFGISGVAYFIAINKNEFRKAPNLNRYFILELCIAFSLMASLVLQKIFLVDEVDNFNRSSFFTALIYATVGLIYFYMGAAMQGYEGRLKFKALWFVPITFLAVSIVASTDGGFVVAYSALSESRSDGIKLDHLLIGEASIVLVLASIAYSPKWAKLVVYVLSIMCLFALGGRTVVGAFVTALLIRELLHGNYAYLLKFFAALCLVAVAIYFYFDVDLNDPAITRMTFGRGFDGDESKVARDELLKNGIRHLVDQALFGDPNIIIKNFGNLGDYSHNLLSAWQFFGVVPFALFVVSIVAISKFIYKNRGKLARPIDEFGLLLFFVSLASVLIGKAINYSLFWVAIGFWLYRAREDINSKYKSNIK